MDGKTNSINKIPAKINSMSQTANPTLNEIVQASNKTELIFRNNTIILSN